MNVLLVLTDQQRFDSLGCYGCDVIPTPNIDRLAKEGVLFENCYVNNPMCTPSRASIWTGKHLPDHGVYTLHHQLPHTEVLFTKHLQDAGYKTGLFGKLHVSGRIYEREQRHPGDGFDVYEYALSPYHYNTAYHHYGEWLKEQDPEFYSTMDAQGTATGFVPEHLHYTRWSVDRAKHFLDGVGRDPFFCCVSLIDPHDPYDDHPESALELVDEDKLREHFEADTTPSLPSGAERESNHGYLGARTEYSAEEVFTMRRSYFASLAYMDRELGTLFEYLEEKDLKENTLIIFASDHGDMLGQRGLLAKGGFFYDPCTKVPCIVRSPNGDKGTRVSSIVQPHDIAATVLKAAGYDSSWIRERLPDSKNLLEHLEGEDSEDRFAVCMYRNSGINDRKLHWDPPIHGTMLRSSRYKLILYHGSPCVDHIIDGELFDLVDDPQESRNLYEDPEHASIRTELVTVLQTWLKDRNSETSGGRGGTKFPPQTEWRKNNPIRIG